jgi:hypothetical protein
MKHPVQSHSKPHIHVSIFSGNIYEVMFFFEEHLPEDVRKNAETCRGLTLRMYVFTSNCCAVVGINTVKLCYSTEHG